MSENQKVETFEKKILFGVVRWFSLAMGAFGLCMLLYGGIMLVKSWTAMSVKTDVKIEYREVDAEINKMNSQIDVSGQTEPASPNLPGEKPNPEQQKLVDEIVKLLVADNPNVLPDKLKEILTNQSAGLEEKEIIPFLKSMKDVVAKAPAGEKANYTDKYIELHSKKLQQENMKAEGKKFEALKKLGIYAYVTISGLLTVVSFGIILILAAIERNTRKETA